MFDKRLICFRTITASRHLLTTMDLGFTEDRSCFAGLGLSTQSTHRAFSNGPQESITYYLIWIYFYPAALHSAA